MLRAKSSLFGLSSVEWYHLSSVTTVLRTSVGFGLFQTVVLKKLLATAASLAITLYVVPHFPISHLNGKIFFIFKRNTSIYLEITIAISMGWLSMKSVKMGT